jgi:hypothetical protein
MTPTEFWEDSFEQKPQDPRDRLACAMMGKYAEYLTKELIEALNNAHIIIAAEVYQWGNRADQHYNYATLKQIEIALKKAGVEI